MLYTNRVCRNGFTLVELLVVIAIIAMLAALLLPALTRALGKGEEARAKVEVKSIETALKQYLSDYGRFPHIPQTPDLEYGSSPALDNAQLMNVLRSVTGTGNNNGTNNARRITYIEVDDTSLVNGAFVDPWGNQYFVAVDTDFNNTLQISIAGNLVTNLQGRNIAVWSLGPKAVTGNAADYFKSWDLR